MEKKVLNNDFMQRIADETAWRKLSSDLYWSENLLDKYKEKVDWKEISSNSDILWSISMIQKFKNLIDWDALSENICKDSLTEDCINTFVEKWNWSQLSANSNLKLSFQLLDKHIDNWDWSEIINRWGEDLFDCKGIDFYERYKKYIPAGELQHSRLWDEIVAQCQKQIMEEITA